VVRIDRFERNVDMETISAGRLRIALESHAIQDVTHDLSGLHYPVERAMERVKIDQYPVGVFERTDTAHPWVVVDAAEVDQVNKRSAIVGDSVVDCFRGMTFVNGFHH